MTGRRGKAEEPHACSPRLALALAAALPVSAHVYPNLKYVTASGVDLVHVP